MRIDTQTTVWGNYNTTQVSKQNVQAFDIFKESLTRLSSAQKNERSNAVNFSDELSLYNDITKDYPNVSFRLGNQSDDTTADFSFHQTKDGFSNPTPPSITIDKNLLTKALNDKQYEEKLRGYIETVVYNYDNITRRSAGDLPYCAITLSENNGKLQTEVTRAAQQFSTDEQLKQMHHTFDTIDIDGLLELIRKMQQDTKEQLFQNSLIG